MMAGGCKVLVNVLNCPAPGLEHRILGEKRKSCV